MYGLLTASLLGMFYFIANPTRVQITSSFPYLEKVTTVKADINDKKSPISVASFQPNEQEYEYVTYTELSANNELYDGKFISQWGKVKKVIASDTVGRKLVLDLNESKSADIILVNYHLSNLAKGMPNIKVNDHVKVFGEGISSTSRNSIPEIEAHFIKNE